MVLASTTLDCNSTKDLLGDHELRRNLTAINDPFLPPQERAMAAFTPGKLHPDAPALCNAKEVRLYHHNHQACLWHRRDYSTERIGWAAVPHTFPNHMRLVFLPFSPAFTFLQHNHEALWKCYHCANTLHPALFYFAV